MDMNGVIERIKELCAIESPTGMAGAAADYVEAELEKLGVTHWRTHKGNVVACLGGEGAPIALCAHVDTLGLMVSAIKPTGRLKFSHIGGISDNSIENENVRIHTRDGRVYEGTVQSIYASRHVFAGKDQCARDTDNMEIVIDEVVHSAEDVRALGIMNGNFVTLDPRTRVTGSGYIKSRHLDDKACSALLIELAARVKRGEFTPARKTYIMFSVYEEVLHGASSGLPEDVEDLLIVDMGCVGGDLEGDETRVSIDAKDAGGPYNYEMTTRLIELAQKNGLDFAVDVFNSYTSDAATALRGGRDIRHALIGPGVFASHGYERTHVRALEGTLRLMEAYLGDRA